MMRTKECSKEKESSFVSTNQVFVLILMWQQGMLGLTDTLPRQSASHNLANVPAK